MLRVGPGEAITRIADAAKVAQDGDVVEILPGEYHADVTVWEQKRLVIRGIGERPVLIADGSIAEGKAIWVIRDGDFLIDNVEFRGARADDENGAGIRFERGRLEVRNSVFLDNQNGILTANFGDAELVIRDSVFAQAPRKEGALPHLLYVGRIGRFEVSGSRFHNGYRGHLLKSRARYNDIRYNLIYDGPQGEASYEIDLPNGGLAFVVGNIVDALDGGGRCRRKLLGADDVGRQRHLNLGHDRFCLVDEVAFGQRFADILARSEQEGVGNAATDD